MGFAQTHHLRLLWKIPLFIALSAVGINRSVALLHTSLSNQRRAPCFVSTVPFSQNNSAEVSLANMTPNSTSKITPTKSKTKQNQRKTPTSQTIFSKGSPFKMLRKLFFSIGIENPSGLVLYLNKQVEQKQARIFVNHSPHGISPPITEVHYCKH